jgi:Tfp pilus assembly protein PilF
MIRTILARCRLCPGPLPIVLVCVASTLSAQSSPEAESRFSAGITHLREGRVDYAVEELKAAVKADPKNPYFRKGLGQAYSAKRSWGDAIAEFKKALELNPYYADVRNDLGMALINSGDRDGGKKELVAAYSDPMNPTPEITAYNLGFAFAEEGAQGDAVNWYRTSISRNKTNPSPYIALADVLLRGGRIDEAVAQLEAGVAAVPEDPALLLALGQAYFKAGRFTEARERFEETLRRDPAGPSGRAAAEQLKALPR